jgi:hypothetical protein
MPVTIATSGKVDPALTGSVVIPLDAAPSENDLLIAFINTGQFGSARTVSSPAAGFTQWGRSVQTNDAIDVWTRFAPAGAGTSYTFGLSASDEFASGLMYAISGADLVNPINNSSASAFSKSASTSSLATASVTPTVVGCLAISGFTQDSNGAGTTNSGAGWTEDKTAASGSGRGGIIAHKDSLTSDTTTAISVTWTISSGATEALSVILLIQPQQPEVTHGGHWNFRQRTRPAPFKPMGDGFQPAKYRGWK